MSQMFQQHQRKLVSLLLRLDAECAERLTLLLLVAKMRAHPSVSVLHPGTESRQLSLQPNCTNTLFYLLCLSCVCVCVQH